MGSRTDGPARVAREELLKLQVGQQVRLQITGTFAAGRRTFVYIGWSYVDTRMFETRNNRLRHGEVVSVYLRGYVRRIGKKGGLSLKGASSWQSSVAAVDVTDLEVLK